MADITLTRGSSLPDSSAKADFHGLVDNATAAISNIVNADISNSAAIASSKLDLSAVGQNIVMSSKAINGAKGSDIASATTTDIGAATGNFVDVTGTTTITGLGTVQAGTIRFVRFTGILTLTHNGTSLILPTGSNVTTAAGDRAIFVSLGSGNWLCLAYQRADGTPLGSNYTPTASNALSGSVIQSKYDRSSALDTTTTVLPYDNSAPTNSEGDSTDLSVAITPNNTNNTVEVSALVYLASTSGAVACVAALFEGSTCVAYGALAGGTAGPVPLFYSKEGSVGTSELTYTVRYGPGSSGTCGLNCDTTGTVIGGAVAKSFLCAREIKA